MKRMLAALTILAAVAGMTVGLYQTAQANSIDPCQENLLCDDCTAVPSTIVDPLCPSGLRVLVTRYFDVDSAQGIFLPCDVFCEECTGGCVPPEI